MPGSFKMNYTVPPFKYAGHYILNLQGGSTPTTYDDLFCILVFFEMD
jgi:hypothetical protein